MFGLKLLRNRARGATSFFGWKPISSALADNKAYIRVSGTESKKFLQGICTFDTARLEKEGNCVPGLFLTPKGRILADAIVYEVPNKSDSGVRDIIIETAKDSVNTLFQQLRLYRMRSKIGLEIISDVSTLLTSRKCQKSSPDVAISASASAGASTGDGDGDGDGAETEAKASIHMFPIDSILCQSQDPRMKVEFLDRLLVHMSVEQAAECVKKSEQGKDTLIPVVVSSDLDTSRPLSLPGKDQDEVVDSAADWYTNIRVIYGVSEGLECISKIPLEFNFDLLRAIDFNKGCYVGQELTARTKHQGLVRKRVVPFVLDKSFLSASSGSFAHLSESGLETLLKTGWKSKPQAIDAQSSSPLLSKGCKLYARKAGSLENNPAKVGEIICMNANASVGLSMFRVGHLLDSTNEYFVHVDHVASNADNNGSSSGNDSEDENSSATPDTGSGEWLPVFPYRPQWWLDNDPLTGNPVISCK